MKFLDRAFHVHGDGGRAVSRKIESMEFMRAGQTRARKSRTPYITLGLEWTFIFCQQPAVSSPFAADSLYHDAESSFYYYVCASPPPPSYFRRKFFTES